MSFPRHEIEFPLTLPSFHYVRLALAPKITVQPSPPLISRGKGIKNEINRINQEK
jgi:hypothetical protein